MQWQHYGLEKATWEDEQVMKESFSGLFAEGEHRDNVPFWGGDATLIGVAAFRSCREYGMCFDEP